MKDNIIDQLSCLVAECLSSTGAKARKPFRNNLIKVVILSFAIQVKLNFTQLAKIGDKCVKTFREFCRNQVEWISLNIHLANTYYADRKERSAIVIDHSYRSITQFR